MEAAVNVTDNYPDGAWTDPAAPWNWTPREPRTCGKCGNYVEAPKAWCRVPFGRCHLMCCWVKADDDACEVDFEEMR